MPAVSKFSYLMSVLKGSVLSAIAGIPLTSENCSLVVKLLQERFAADYASSFEVQLFEERAERVSIVSHSRNTSYK